MDMKKIAFLLFFGLCIGYSGFSFAADSPTKKPAVSKPSVKSDAHDMADHSAEHKNHSEEPKGGVAGNQMCCQMCGMKDGQMCGMCGMKGGQMCGQMGRMKGGQMCGQMGNMKDNQMCGQMCGQMGSHEGMHMSGMMGHHEPGAMMKRHIGMVMTLELSDEQRSRINKLSDELTHNNWVTTGSITDESAKLRDLYAADKRDPSAIGKEYQKIFDMERQMIEATVDTQNRIEELLTPEQRTQLKDMHHKMGAMRCYQKQ